MGFINNLKDDIDEVEMYLSNISKNVRLPTLKKEKNRKKVDGQWLLKNLLNELRRNFR